jgi:hypothetical protein
VETSKDSAGFESPGSLILLNQGARSVEAFRFISIFILFIYFYILFIMAYRA